jgi:hypothetical protein
MNIPEKRIPPSWVKKYLYPFRVCRPVIRKARKFADSQLAWNAWTDAGEMFWLLSKLHRYHHPLVCCAAELVAPMRTILKKSSGNIERFLQTLDAVDVWSKEPTSHFENQVTSLLYGMKERIRGSKRLPHQAATAVYRLALGISHSHNLVELPCAVAFATLYNSTQWYELLADDQLTPLEFSSHIQKKLRRIGRSQCDCIRKHFPISPFVENDD